MPPIQGGLVEAFEVVFEGRRRRLRNYTVATGLVAFVLALLACRGFFRVYPEASQFEATRSVEQCWLKACSARAAGDATVESVTARTYVTLKAHLCAEHLLIANGRGRWPGRDAEYSAARQLLVLVAAFLGLTGAAVARKVLGALPTFSVVPAGSFTPR